MRQKEMPELSRTSKVLGIDRFGNIVFTDAFGKMWVGLNDENVFVSQDTQDQIKYTNLVLWSNGYAVQG